MVELPQTVKSGKRTDKTELVLPPARFHYAEETKLNAISLLISTKSDSDYALVSEGIQSLGKMELHSALNALAACDLAEDHHVFALIEKNVCLPQPEYRIYSAWLLRNRYGDAAAGHLVRLLTDDETRVHRFALQVFKKRKIEPELIRQILTRI